LRKFFFSFNKFFQIFSFSLSSISSSSSTSIDADRYLLKILRRARNRFIQHKYLFDDERRNIKTISIDNQSDSGIFTTSSKTNFTDDLESNSLLDIDEDYLRSIDTDEEILCQSLEVALMETLIELRQLRSNKDQIFITRL
jgi:hypothetical protein